MKQRLSRSKKGHRVNQLYTSISRDIVQVFFLYRRDTEVGAPKAICRLSFLLRWNLGGSFELPHRNSSRRPTLPEEFVALWGSVWHSPPSPLFLDSVRRIILNAERAASLPGSRCLFCLVSALSNCPPGTLPLSSRLSFFPPRTI